jgi:hypothetical protein
LEEESADQRLKVLDHVCRKTYGKRFGRPRRGIYWTFQTIWWFVREEQGKKKRNAVRSGRPPPKSTPHTTTVSRCKVAAASSRMRRSSATSSWCILLRMSLSVMGSSSQRLCPSSAAGTVGRSWSSGVHERHPPLDPYAVCPMGQVKHTVPVRRALGFVLGQREGRTHRNLMPPDSHVAHF